MSNTPIYWKPEQWWLEWWVRECTRARAQSHTASRLPACLPAIASRLAFRGAGIFLDSNSFDKCARSAERDRTYIRTLRRASSIPTSYLIWDSFNGVLACVRRHCVLMCMRIQTAYTLYICLLRTQQSALSEHISASCNGCIFSGVYVRAHQRTGGICVHHLRHPDAIKQRLQKLQICYLFVSI